MMRPSPLEVTAGDFAMLRVTPYFAVVRRRTDAQTALSNQHPVQLPQISIIEKPNNHLRRHVVCF